ncbi:hypothetical protein [Streptosporangium sp. NPDC002721]|uniref:hypothetical protein n=1 Tax=Streptosporangium sp. NPDC002721 TaxID=3366188 RepID=UPI0036A827B2
MLRCVTLWTTAYLDVAVRRLKAQGYPVREKDLENISCPIGHKGTAVTEKIYRRQLRPVLLDGAGTMDMIFSIEAKKLGHPEDRKRPLPCREMASELGGATRT